MVLNEQKIIDTGRESIKAEINGLNALFNSIDDNFIKFIKTILNTKGRIFLSAVGKPSYIAHKVAATLSSTGTPSFFIHPDEASHGDLGMITKDDMVILLSNSGGSTELNDIIAYCKRFSIKIVGLTRKKDSFLAKSADIPIVLDNIPETNAVNSPTTSAIMFLSYLDAIITVLIDIKGFGNENYKIFHPGGKLGAALIKVKDIMRVENKVPIIDLNDTVENAINKMTEKAIGAICVISKSKLIGIISDGDLRRKTIEYKNIIDKSIEDIMTKDPIAINEDSLAIEAVNLMTEKGKYIQVIPVTNNNNELVGIIHIQDLFKTKII